MDRICPNCNKEMKTLIDSIWDQTDGEDYDFAIGAECKKCKIRYYNGNDRHAIGWELPKELEPTVKQERAEWFIKHRLRYATEIPVTKTQHCQFISKYFEKAKRTDDEYDDWYDNWYDNYHDEEF